MATKAELLASIAELNKHVNTLTAVATALPDDPVVKPTTPVVIYPSDVSVEVNNIDGIVVTAPQSLTHFKWVRVNGQSGKWYGNIVRMPINGRTVIGKVAYERPDVDYVLVLWGGTNDMDSSMDTRPKATTPPVPSTPIPSTPTPTVPAQPASTARHRFVAGMHVGTNQERHNMVGIQYQGADPRKTTAFSSYLTNIGTDWDRYFSAVNFTMDRGCGVGIPGIWACDQLLDCAVQATNVKRRVLYSPLDVIDKAELANWDKIVGWFKATATRVKERGPDPEYFAFELANEWATNDADICNKRRNELYVIARSILPNYRLVVGGPEWNGWHRFDKTWQPPADADYFIGFHHYEARSVTAWADVQDHMIAFGKKYDVPVFNGELNIGFNQMKQADHAGLWAQNFLNFAKTGRQMPFAPWGFIGGKNDFRLNISGTDPRAIPLMEDTFKKCAAFLSLA